MTDYVCYRLPDNDNYHVIKGRARYLDSLDTFVGEAGFVMAPFHQSNLCPVVFVPSEEDVEKKVPRQMRRAVVEVTERSYHTAYRHDFHSLHVLLDDDVLRKVTLTRRADIKVSEWSGNVLHLFKRACLLFPHRFVALVVTDKTGAWLMVSSELLSRADGDTGEVPNFPVPAVCGEPGNKALQALFQIESVDRRYFSGFCGPWGHGEADRLYLSSCSMEIRDEKNFSIYAATTMQKKSIEKDEWRLSGEEIELMKKILGNIAK